MLKLRAGRVGGGESESAGGGRDRRDERALVPALDAARGRCERAFRTLQDRLPKELALAGIATVEAANAFLRERDRAAHDARFAVTPTEEGSAFVPVAEAQWRDLLCIQDERTVAPDNTSWNGRRLQIPPHPARAHFVRAKVRVHGYPDSALAIFQGPRCLVRWNPDPELRAVA